MPKYLAPLTLSATTWAVTPIKRALSVLVAVAAIFLLAAATPAGAATPAAIGRLDSVQSYAFTNNLVLTGWTVDPAHRDRSNSVEVTVDKRSTGLRAAAIMRADVNHANTSTGGHGFVITVAVPAGEHTICVNARTSTGSTTSLGCFAFTGYQQASKAAMLAMAKTIDPRGTINWVWTAQASTIFAGRAMPWNNTIEISSGNTTRYLRAVMIHEWSHVLQYRAFGGGNGWWDAMGAFNALVGDPNDQDSANGVEHGADCIAQALGANYAAYGCPAALRVFGARIAHGVSMTTPQGTLGSAAVAGSTVTASGWSVDPSNPTSAIKVQVTDNGKAVSSWTTTAVTRNDVNATLGVTGRHGFTVAVKVAAGQHRICVSAQPLDAGRSAVALTGCTTVTSH